MHVVLVLPHAGFFRHFDAVVRRLAAEGHAVTVARGELSKENVSEAALAACLAASSTCQSAWLRQRADRWSPLARAVRAVRDWAIYAHPCHSSPALAYRFQGGLPPGVRWLSRWRPGVRLIAHPLAQRLLRWLEDRIPADAAIVEQLRTWRPSMVLASPYILKDSLEVDYVKAAQSLGIPTVVAVASWDNLTTKGTFQAQPSMTLVWNAGLKDEAVNLHGLPADRVVLTGAPTFDAWFDARPSVDADAFRARVGLPRDAEFVLYVCSSGFIAGDETGFVRELAATLAGRPLTAGMQVVVRPHPFNAAIWDDVAAPNLVVWPRGGAYPDVPNAQQDFVDALHHSRAVIGVNTSAFLEAAIANRPCLTIVSERYHATQAGIGHFRHLLDGGFLETTHSFDAAAEALAAIAAGVDRLAAQRQRFVADFLRPWGMHVPASEVMARVLTLVAARPDARGPEIEATLVGDLTAGRQSSAAPKSADMLKA